MKRALILFLVMMITTAALAQDRNVRTVVVRDGKVVEGELPDGFEFIVAGNRAFLGVTLTDLTSELREHFGAGRDAGVMVGSVEKGGPADKAGARTGDIIVSVDGKSVASAWDIRRALRDKKDGDSIRLEVIRNGSRQALVASVVERQPAALKRLEDLDGRLGTVIGAPEWRGRIAAFSNCDELQSRIKDLEARLKDLEKKLK
jgi:serine protease Do